MSKEPKTAEQINREAGVMSASDVYNEFSVRCTKCKVNIRQQLIGEIIQHVKKEYVPGKDADIFIEDLEKFKRGE